MCLSISHIHVDNLHNLQEFHWIDYFWNRNYSEVYFTSNCGMGVGKTTITEYTKDSAEKKSDFKNILFS